MIALGQSRAFMNPKGEMMNVNDFLDSLERGGYWEETCTECGCKFSAPEGEEICSKCEDNND